MTDGIHADGNIEHIIEAVAVLMVLLLLMMFPLMTVTVLKLTPVLMTYCR